MKENWTYYVLFFLLFNCSQASGQLLINEFMASNSGSVIDSFNESSDWIEIYNQSADTVLLKGWVLSDNENDLNKWSFPDIEILPDSFLLIFASGKDVFDGYYWHTNFKLSSLGEKLFLLNSNQVVVDEYIFRNQITDVSLGRKKDGSDEWVYFKPTTPGFSNDSILEFEPEFKQLYFSLPSGFYEENIELEIFSEESVDIFYSLDGSIPDTNDHLYNTALDLRNDNHPELFISQIPTGIGWRQPYEVNQCHVVRARAYQNGSPISDVISGSFFIEEEGEDRYDMPVVSLMTESKNLFSPDSGIYHIGKDENYFKRGIEWERITHLEFFEDNGDLEIKQDVGIRISGGGSRIRPQKSLKFYAREEYGKSTLDYDFFEEEGGDYKRLVIRALNNNWNPTALSDDLAQQICLDRNLNLDCQRRKFVIAFINGEYWGIHSLRESSDEFFIERKFDIDRDNVVLQDFSRNSFKTFVEQSDMTDPDNYKRFLEEADADNLMDYYATELFFANHDWPHNNTKFWKITDSDDYKWRWLLFDLDGGFQQYRHGHFRLFFEPEELHIREDRFFGFVFFRSLLQNETFRSDFRAKLIYHLNNSFNPSATTKILRELQSEMAPEIAEHIKRWDYPDNVRLWNKSIDNVNNFLVIRVDQFLIEIFEKLGIPLDVFPNPTSDYIRGELEVSVDQEVNFYATSQVGQMLFLGSREMIVGKNTFNFDISNLPLGNYMFTALTRHQIFTKQVIVID